MKFNPLALVVFIAFAALLAAATSSGSTTTHIVEAICTVIIAFGVGSLGLRRRHRSQ
jgi:uncharacterized membrane protein (DUF485 family)